MPSKIDAISSGLALINVAMPGIVSLVATFAGGQQVDIQKLLDDTDEKVDKIISEGTDFLAQAPEPMEPLVPDVPAVTTEPPPEPE